MVQRKYRLLFSPKQRRKPGPKGPTADLIRAVIEMKRRNPSWGSPQIAEQINLAFGTSINKDVVRRILATQYSPSTEGGPSWLTFIGHMKDSLWSLDFFRCESIALQTYWVLVVMDQYTRRIIGFGIQRGVVDGLALCRMFKQAIRGAGLPKYVSSDHDPLYRFHQWGGKPSNSGHNGNQDSSVHSLVASVCRETDRNHPPRMSGPALLWTAIDLETKLIAFKDYYNGYRSHSGLKGKTPIETLE